MNALILQLVAFQVLLPLALIAANALVPAASLAALLLRAGAVLVVVAYVALAGMWLFPPYWTPWVLGLLHAAGTTYAAMRLHRRGRKAPAWRRWGEPTAGLVALAAVAFLAAPAVRGQMRPDGAVDMAMPLGPGRYLVVSGGSTLAVNTHLATLAGERFSRYRGQSRAVDLIGIDGAGLRASGIAPRDPAAYAIYGTEVRAPCDGTVLTARDGLPDLDVPQADRDNLAGNHVMIECGPHVVVLAHLMRGSVAVSPGAFLAQGERVGRVGNSGNTSEPHLHMHVQRGVPTDAPLGGEPVWFTVHGRFLVRGAVLRVP